MITLIVCVLVLFSSAFVVVVSDADTLTLLPINPVVCISQNITLTCNDPVQNATALYFAIPTMKEAEVTNINGTKVNETAYEHTLYNVSKDYYNQNIYCCRGNCNNPSAIYNEQSLRVYHMPEPVNNFHCVVYSSLQNLSCHWDLAAPYNTDVTVKVYWMLRNNGEWMPCPYKNSTHCLCNSTNGDFFNKKIRFKVDVLSKCGINTTSEYKNALKPAQVLNLTSTAANSSCATLTWATIDEYGKVYFVNYTSKWGNGKNSLNDTEEKTLSKNMTVCDLHPYTTYTFTVQAMLWETDYLSDHVTTTVLTLQDIPAAAPEVKDGGYMWNPKECSQGNVLRHIYIYWKPLPDESKNGVLTEFQLEFEPAVLVNVSVVNVSAAYTYAKYILKCEVYYNISISARNGAGLSTKKSSLHIPKAQTALQPQFIVETSNKTNNSCNIHITLKHSNVAAKGYTVFWCRKDQGNCMINKSVDWLDYESTVTEINLPSNTFMNTMNPEDYLYGVAMNTKHGSSGLSWQSCVYTRHIKPRSPENLIVTNGPYDNSLDIRWDKLMCESGQPFISTYRVEICQEDNVFQCEYKEEIDNSLHFYNLDAEKRYLVKVQGITSGDYLQGFWSQEISGQPVNKSLKKEAIAGIGLACLIVLILVLAGFVCIFQHCLKTGKKKWNVSIMVPVCTAHCNFNTVPKPCDRHDSQDSGFPEDLSISSSPKTNKQYNLPPDYVQATTDGILEDASSDLESIEVASIAHFQETNGGIPEGNLSDTDSTHATSEDYVPAATNTTPKERSIDIDSIGEPGKALVHVAFVTIENQLTFKQLFDSKLLKSKLATVSAAGIEATIDAKVNSAEVVSTSDCSVTQLVNMDHFICHSLNNSHLNELDSLGNKNNNSSHPVATSRNHCIPEYVPVCSTVVPRVLRVQTHAATSEDYSGMNSGVETFKCQIDNENANNFFTHLQQNSSSSSSWPEMDIKANNLDLHVMTNDIHPVAPDG